MKFAKSASLLCRRYKLGVDGTQIKANYNSVPVQLSIYSGRQHNLTFWYVVVVVWHIELAQSSLINNTWLLGVNQKLTLPTVPNVSMMALRRL